MTPSVKTKLLKKPANKINCIEVTALSVSVRSFIFDLFQAMQKSFTSPTEVQDNSMLNVSVNERFDAERYSVGKFR